MAQPRRQQRRGGRGVGLRRLAVLLVLLLSLCLARLDAAAADSAASPEWKEGAANFRQKKHVGQEAARGFTATPEEEGPAVPERVEMELINDYPQIGANNRHNPHP